MLNISNIYDTVCIKQCMYLNMNFKRIKATVEYDGTNYSGFQRQPIGIPTVQQEIETALYKLCQAEVKITASGRTDAGVHALGQVIHFDVPSRFSEDEIQGALNSFLCKKIIVLHKVEKVQNNFDARFDAIERKYIYKIISRRAPLALDKNRAWHVKHKLNILKMQEAAEVFIGKHNFNTFRSSECQAKSAIRTINDIFVRQNGECINIIFSAKSFLHNQVRIMVGAIKDAGEENYTKDDIVKALAMENRIAGPQTAPACGLYFLSVKY